MQNPATIRAISAMRDAGQSAGKRMITPWISISTQGNDASDGLDFINYQCRKAWLIVSVKNQLAFLRLTTPTAQMLWCKPVPTGNITHATTGLIAFKHNPGFLFVRPASAASRSCQNMQMLDPFGRLN